MLFDGHGLTGEPAGERRVDDSSVARLVSAMLPPVQYASLLVDVHRDTGLLDELRHYGQGARSQARQGQLVAALLADIFGVGYARMALACAYSEREMREAAGRHFTAENLDAASAVVVQKLRLLPHEWIAELLMTSSDGTRLETIGKSPIAAYAARHAGYRRRVLTWLLWLTGEYGHFGGKVIPVNEPESWHTLDALVHLDTPTVQHTTDTHGTTELTFAIADLLGWEFYPRLADLTDRWLYLLGQPDPLIAAEQLLTHRIQVELILEQWDELLRIAGSIKRGWIVPSVLISRMASDPKPDRTARALREYGRLIETNFILHWAGDPPLRQGPTPSSTKARTPTRCAARSATATAAASAPATPSSSTASSKPAGSAPTRSTTGTPATSRSSSRTSNDSGSRYPTGRSPASTTPTTSTST